MTHTSAKAGTIASLSRPIVSSSATAPSPRSATSASSPKRARPVTRRPRAVAEITANTPPVRTTPTRARYSIEPRPPFHSGLATQAARASAAISRVCGADPQSAVRNGAMTTAEAKLRSRPRVASKATRPRHRATPAISGQRPWARPRPTAAPARCALSATDAPGT